MLFSVPQTIIILMNPAISLGTVRIILCGSFCMCVKSTGVWDFPGGPAVKAPCFYCRGVDSIPFLETKIPKAHSGRKIKGIDLFNFSCFKYAPSFFFFFLINIFRLKNIPFILTVLSLCC